MARTRLLKPGFFANETLVDIEPMGRLLFAGLWCYADREGRMEDRPRRIKASIFPYEDCDVDKLLGRLSEKGFIVRYCSGESLYIQIVNFTKHQTPHMKEAASSIPAPESLVLAREIPILATTKDVTSPSVYLNPLPLTLNPLHEASDDDWKDAIEKGARLIGR